MSAKLKPRPVLLIAILVIGLLVLGSQFISVDDLQGRFSLDPGASLPELPTVSTENTCLESLDTTIFVDASAAPGGTGSFVTPYNGLVPVEERLVQDDYIDTVCVTGHLYGMLDLDDVAMSELTFREYGSSAAIIETNMAVSAFSFAVDNPLNLSELYVSGIDFIGYVEAEDIDTFVIEDGEIDGVGSGNTLYVNRVPAVNINNMSVYGAITNVLLLKEIDVLSVQDVQVGDMSTSLAGRGVYVQDVSEATISDVEVWNTNSESFYLRESSSLAMEDVSSYNSLEEAFYIDDITDVSVESASVHTSASSGFVLDEIENFYMSDGVVGSVGSDGILIGDVSNVEIRNSNLKYLGSDAIDANNVGSLSVYGTTFNDYASSGIDIDLEDSVLVLDGNIFFGASTSKEAIEVSSQEITITNNFFLDHVSGQAIHLYDAGNVVISHNSFLNNEGGVHSNGVDTLVVKNNIFSSVVEGQYAIAANGNASALEVYDYNLYDGDVAWGSEALIDWQEEGFDEHSIEGDPAFVSSSDLHITASSDAIGVGTALPSVAADIDGDGRTSTPDMGADQF